MSIPTALIIGLIIIAVLFFFAIILFISILQPLAMISAIMISVAVFLRIREFEFSDDERIDVVVGATIAAIAGIFVYLLFLQLAILGGIGIAIYLIIVGLGIFDIIREIREDILEELFPKES